MKLKKSTDTAINMISKTDKSADVNTISSIELSILSKIKKKINRLNNECDIMESEVDGKTIFNVGDGYLVACFDQEVSDEVVTAIAKMQPTYAVLRDTSLADDATATNFEQIFKTYAPNTTTKIL